MKISLLTKASLSVLCLISLTQATETENDKERLESLFNNPKFKPNTLGNVIPGRFIVEFDEDYHGSGLEFVNDIEKDISATELNLNSHIKLSIAHDFNSNSAIFRGISISLQEIDSVGMSKLEESSEEEKTLHMQSIHNTVLKKILQQHRVKHVYPVTEFQRPKVEYHSSVDAYELKNDEVISKVPDLELSNVSSPLPFSHAMAQVDKVVNQLDFKGKGVLIGIIDSGIDYRHPAFGGGFGPGFPVKVGLDYVGNKFNSRDPLSRRQSDTPLDDCLDGNGHGTHVAGIIAANDRLFNFTGVAPEVNLGVWRIFGCDGATSNDLVIKALISAHEAGCDVINLSLGSSSNWAEDPTAIIANRISEQGSIVIAAAGNDGAEGAFYISSPGTGSNTIAAASVDNLYNLQQTAVSEEGAEYPYLLSSSSKSFPSGLVMNYSNRTLEADACNEVKPDNNITGKIALVQRGKCTFDEKSLLVEKFGAIGILLYDNEPENGFKPQSLKSKLPMTSITMDAGADLKKLIDTKYKNGIKMDFKTALTPQKVSTAKAISKFSSFGPLYDMSMKPDFAGPGGFIFSTLPIANGGYGMLSGTSMAAPYIAGAYALYIQAHGKDKGPKYLREHFQNYASPVMHGKQIENPIRQGAGLLQLYDTINQKVHISPGHLSFNDTINIKPQKLTISNHGNTTVSYKITHKPSVAITPFNTTLQGYAPLQPPRYSTKNIEATLEFSNNQITLLPGESKTLDLRVSNISALSSKDEPLPIYGGFVQLDPINNTDIKSMHVPYVGIRGSLASLPIFAEGYPRFLITNTTILFEQSLSSGEKNTGIVLERRNKLVRSVTCLFRLLSGSPQTITEVLDKDLKKVGIFSQESYLTRNTMSDLNFVFAQRWNGTIISNNATELDGLVPLPAGFYRLRWKALKLLSSPEKEESWETKLSPLILIQD